MLQDAGQSDYARFPVFQSPQPPCPPRSPPVRVLEDNWEEYRDAMGRLFYHNSVTDKSSWKPPRKTSSPGKTQVIKIMRC